MRLVVLAWVVLGLGPACSLAQSRAGVGAPVVPPAPAPPRPLPLPAAPADLAALWEAAVAAFYRGELEEAAALLERARSGGEGPARRIGEDLASIYRQLGAVEKAAEEYARLVQADTRDARLAAQYAWSLLAAGKNGAAAELFERALALGLEEPWAYVGLGLARERGGESAEAAAAYRRAVALDDSFALAWERLGVLHRAEGRLADAVEAWRKALQVDPSYAHLNIELAEAYEALGRLRDAWTYYDRAARVFPQDARVQGRVRAFLQAHRDVVDEAERARALGRRRLEHVRLSEPPPRGGVRVRVGLVEGADAVYISAGGPFHVRADSSAGESREGEEPLPAGLYQLRIESGALTIRPAEEENAPSRSFPGAAQLRLERVDPATTWIVLDLDAGRGYFWSFVEDLQVRGELIALARSRGLTLVNELDIEEYLLAVVPSEMYASMPFEALKAQAIAARTYTLRSLGRYRERGFDVMGSVLSSAYRGVGREHPRTSAAVAQTRGQVLTYQGALIEAYYHASAGGHTAASAQVWGGARPYLSGVGEWPGAEPASFLLSPHELDRWFTEFPDVYSHGTGFGLRSSFRWSVMHAAETIRRRIGDDALGRIAAIVPGPRGLGGWVSAVTIVGTEGVRRVSGDAVRSRLGGLKSSAFTVVPLLGPDGLPEHFLFVGGGFGHGVGLSQLGAAGMAQRGASAEEILAHYYPGAVVTADYNRNSP